MDKGFTEMLKEKILQRVFAAVRKPKLMNKEVTSDTVIFQYKGDNGFHQEFIFKFTHSGIECHMADHNSLSNRVCVKPSAGNVIHITTEELDKQLKKRGTDGN